MCDQPGLVMSGGGDVAWPGLVTNGVTNHWSALDRPSSWCVFVLLPRHRNSVLTIASLSSNHKIPAPRTWQQHGKGDNDNDAGGGGDDDHFDPSFSASTGPGVR